MLCRVYPHMKRAVLQIILHSCRGDVIQAIEHVNRTHGDAASAQLRLESTTDLTPMSMSPSLLGKTAGISSTLMALNPALLQYAAYANALTAGLSSHSPYHSLLPPYSTGSTPQIYPTPPTLYNDKPGSMAAAGLLSFSCPGSRSAAGLTYGLIHPSKSMFPPPSLSTAGGGRPLDEPSPQS